MGLRLLVRNKKLRLALGFGVVGGLTNVLVDLDHWFNLIGFKGWGLEGRPLHIPLAIFAGCFGFYCYTRLRGWSTKLVLKWFGIVIAFLAIGVGLEMLWMWFVGTPNL